VNEFIKQNKNLILFAVKFGGLLLIWQLIYVFFLKFGPLDIFVTKYVSEIGKLILNFIGYKITIYQEAAGAQVFALDSHKILRVNHHCNGLILYILFGIFILAFNGKLAEKLIAIFIGMIALLLINSIRVAALIMTAIHAPKYLDISHKYIFTAFVYGVVLWFWMLWIKRSSKNQDS
jgi:exosortase family protein XrtF